MRQTSINPCVRECMVALLIVSLCCGGGEEKRKQKEKENKAEMKGEEQRKKMRRSLTLLRCHFFCTSAVLLESRNIVKYVKFEILPFCLKKSQVRSCWAH